jgi:hypothetical protein
MRTDFVARVEDALCKPGRYPWLPGLVEELADLGWSSLRDDFKIYPSNYGTGRILGRSANTPCEIVAHLQTAIDVEPLRYVPQVEILNGEASRGYKESGVRFYTGEEVLKLNLCGTLEDAISLLEAVPSLREVVVIMVKSIHLIDAGHDDYDVSFSEPNLPFSVFVSMPRSRNINAALRVAEGVIHEAMHLQLSLVERVVALIRSDLTSFFSPWRNEMRTSRGLLHALYVFRVIDCFFRDLLVQKSLSTEHEVYVQDRRQQICEQIREVHGFMRSPDLTQVGRVFVSKLIIEHEY